MPERQKREREEKIRATNYRGMPPARIKNNSGTKKENDSRQMFHAPSGKPEPGVAWVTGDD